MPEALDDRIDFRTFLGQCPIAVLIVDDLRASEQCIEFLTPLGDAIEFRQETVFHVTQSLWNKRGRILHGTTCGFAKARPGGRALALHRSGQQVCGAGILR